MSTGTLVDVKGLHGHDLTPSHIVFERRVRAYYARVLPSPPLLLTLPLSLSFALAFCISSPVLLYPWYFEYRCATSSRAARIKDKGTREDRKKRGKEYSMTLLQNDKTGSEHARGPRVSAREQIVDWYRRSKVKFACAIIARDLLGDERVFWFPWDAD